MTMLPLAALAPEPALTLASTSRVGIFEIKTPHGPDWLFLGVTAAVVLGPLVAGKVRLPGLIGLLAGGLAIGPEGLGIVTATDKTVSGLGQLGLLYLMFSAGLELDLALFRSYRRAAILFGLATFAVPLALGVFAGRLLDYSPEAALLLGSIWASHTLVTYPVVRSAGLSGNRAVATSVGATVLTDTLALVVLAGVAGAEKGDRATSAVLVSLAVGLIGLAAYSALVLPRVTRWFFTGPARDRPIRYSYLLVAMLSAAVLADVVGIEGIVGAFFAGLGLNRMVPAGSPLMDRVEFFGTAVFVPVFLVSVGVLINPSVMVQPATLGLATVFCAVVIAGKAGAAALARPALGFSWSETGLMFGLTLSQAAATLAATFVGFDIGLFGDQVVNAVLVVILVTMVVAALTTERFTERVEPTPIDAGAIGRYVVVPIARADRLASLARVARLVSSPDAGTVLPLRVSRVGEGGLEDDRALLSLAESVFGGDGLDVESRLRIGPDPGQAVVSAVVEEEATLVLLDWQVASRYQPALRGGRDDQLVAELSVPVLLAAMSDSPHGRVVLAVSEDCLDPVAHDDLALGLELARRLQGSDLDLVAVMADEAPGDLVQQTVDLPEALAELPWGDQLESGDLVVFPGFSDWEMFGPAALEASAHPGVSVVVVADSSRWRDLAPSGSPALGALASRHRSASILWP